MTLRETIHEAIADWADQPECDKLGPHEVDEATDAVLAALPAQPPTPALSDEEREHLLELARDLELGKHGYKRHAAFLRTLASQEHGGEGKLEAALHEIDKLGEWFFTRTEQTDATIDEFARRWGQLSYHELIKGPRMDGIYPGRVSRFDPETGRTSTHTEVVSAPSNPQVEQGQTGERCDRCDRSQLCGELGWVTDKGAELCPGCAVAVAVHRLRKLALQVDPLAAEEIEQVTELLRPDCQPGQGDGVGAGQCEGDDDFCERCNGSFGEVGCQFCNPAGHAQAAVVEIPADYWREVPCGHPPDPVAMYNAERFPVCHCGTLLDTAGLLPAPPEAPGPLSHCQKCGCHVAIPPFTEQPEAGGEEDWPELVSEAEQALADFDSHGDYEAPVASLRRIIQKLPATSQDSSGLEDQDIREALHRELDRHLDRANAAEAEAERQKKIALAAVDGEAIQAVRATRAEAALEELATELERRWKQAEAEWQANKNTSTLRTEFRAFRKAHRLTEAAAPAIRSKERQQLEEERCESCDDTGIYEEGDEWAPCGECEIGKGFLERLKTHAEETRQRVREALKEELPMLLGDPFQFVGAPEEDESVESWQARTILQFLDTLPDPTTPEKAGGKGGDGGE